MIRQVQKRLSFYHDDRSDQIYFEIPSELVADIINEDYLCRRGPLCGLILT